MKSLQPHPATTIYVDDEVGANYQSVARIRTSGALLAGCAAGVLGLRGIAGVVFFLLIAVCTSAAIFVRCDSRLSTYFKEGNKDIFAAGAQLAGALTYILAWTVVYDAIYIF